MFVEREREERKGQGWEGEKGRRWKQYMICTSRTKSIHATPVLYAH